MFVNCVVFSTFFSFKSNFKFLSVSSSSVPHQIMATVLNSTNELYSWLMSKGGKYFFLGQKKSFKKLPRKEPSKSYCVKNIRYKLVSNLDILKQSYISILVLLFLNTILIHNFVSKNIPDVRSANWPLMGSPFPILTIIFTYIYFVKVMGPKWMKEKRPYQIEPVIIAYNILMVILSAFFFFYVSFVTFSPCFDIYKFRMKNFMFINFV